HTCRKRRRGNTAHYTAPKMEAWNAKRLTAVMWCQRLEAPTSRDMRKPRLHLGMMAEKRRERNGGKVKRKSRKCSSRWRSRSRRRDTRRR
ncbi:unnamed protein product, partial [Ectocarpus sp. 12 AP-2014]